MEIFDFRLEIGLRPKNLHELGLPAYDNLCNRWANIVVWTTHFKEEVLLYHVTLSFFLISI